jgi:hypothetical protein
MIVSGGRRQEQPDEILRARRYQVTILIFPEFHLHNEFDGTAVITPDENIRLCNLRCRPRPFSFSPI